MTHVIAFVAGVATWSTLIAVRGWLLLRREDRARDAALAPAQPAEHPGDALRAEVLRLAGEFQKAGSEYERGGSASGAAQMRRVSNLLYGLAQDGTGLVFTPVPGDEPAEHHASGGEEKPMSLGRHDCDDVQKCPTATPCSCGRVRGHCWDINGVYSGGALHRVHRDCVLLPLALRSAPAPGAGEQEEGTDG